MASAATALLTEVAATIQVGPAPGFPVTFHAADPTSAKYLVNDSGDWDFRSIKGPVKVRLTIATPDVAFHHGPGQPAVSFADDPAQLKQPVASGHHQFPDDVQHVGSQGVSFTYRNAWDCGVGDGAKRCEKSAYGLYFGDGAGTFLHHHDPIIQNGGGND